MPGIDGFSYSTVAVGPTAYGVGVAGSGPPVLLLHGFPQTHYCWRLVAPALVREGHTVVVCDLKGYAGSPCSVTGGPLGEGFSKREMAAELVELMGRLGFPRFAVCGHDRGARVAYRMAIDHRDAVERLCVLNIVPTVEQFERMAAEAALEYWPWFLLAQPFAPSVVGASAGLLVRDVLRTWPATPEALDPEAVERYVRAFDARAIEGICAEFRAAFHIDRPMDAEFRERGPRIACPVLVHWGASEDAMSDGPLPVWRRWAQDVRGGPLPSGHFLPEEAPERLAGSLNDLLRR